MASTSDDDKNMRIDPAASAAARELMTETVKRDPLYAQTVARYGVQRADFLVTHYGAQALTTSFQDTTPAEMDPGKQTMARLEVFHWAAAHMPGISADEVQRHADSMWDRLSAMDKARLAGAPGTGGAILADALKGDIVKPIQGRMTGTGAAAADTAGSGGALPARSGQMVWVRAGAAASASGNDYSDLPGSPNSFGPEKYTYAQMKGLAGALDVSWALNQPDLLKLGPGALKDIAESGFKRESYTLLARDVGIGARDIVGVARLAKAKHFNADTFAKKATPVIKENSDNDEDAKDAWRKIGAWGYHPQDARAEEAVRAKFDHMRAMHPEHSRQIEALATTLKLKLSLNVSATHAVEAAKPETAKKAADLNAARNQLARRRENSPATGLG